MNRRRLALGILGALAGLHASIAAQTRGVRVEEAPKKSTDGSVHGPVTNDDGEVVRHGFGRYHALLIGIESYRSGADWPPLETPREDVAALAKLLEEDYGFEPPIVLLGAQATRSNILGKLEEFTRRLGDATEAPDNLLIYFAGHGNVKQWPRQEKEGFWIPWDGTDDWTTWIAAAELQRMTRRIRARHVLTIADSCFAAAMNRSTVPPIADRQTLRFAEAPSNQFLSAGGIEPVADGGGHGHSRFARMLLDFLADPPLENPHYPTAQDLAHYVMQMGKNTEQQPEFGLMKGDPRGRNYAVRGQFVFARSRAVEQRSTTRVLERTPGLPLGYRLPAGVRQIAATTPVGGHPEYGGYVYEVVSGPDQGVPMVLVPGDPDRRIGAFLIDRHEVTNARFDAFYREMHKAAGAVRLQELGISGYADKRLKDQPNRPRVWVPLRGARAFAQWATKALPTDAEWSCAAGFAVENAIRMPRRFAWGDTLPVDIPRQLLRIPPKVDEIAPADCSFWGVAGLSSGVSEWCELQTPDANRGVVRGGRQVRRDHRDRWSEASFEIGCRAEQPAEHQCITLGFRCIIRLPKTR